MVRRGRDWGACGNLRYWAVSAACRRIDLLGAVRWYEILSPQAGELGDAYGI